MHDDIFKNWDEQIDPRIESLRKDGYHLEAFYLFTNTVEFILRSSILLQESWIFNCIKRSGLSFKRNSVGDLEKKTLGDLINLFSRYSNDTQLIGKLNNFNSFRIKIIHKVLKSDIAKLNIEASASYVKYNEIVAKVCRYNMSLVGKQISRLNRQTLKLSKKSNKINI
jgi:hypothetical protein